MAMAAGDVAAGGLGAAIGHASGQSRSSSGVRLAVAVLLFWLAGICLFIAFGAGVDAFKGLTWKQGGGSGLTNLRTGLGRLFAKAQHETGVGASGSGNG